MQGAGEVAVMCPSGCKGVMRYAVAGTSYELRIRYVEDIILAPTSSHACIWDMSDSIVLNGLEHVAFENTVDKK